MATDGAVGGARGFEIGLVMAEALSAGAYKTGVTEYTGCECRPPPPFARVTWSSGVANSGRSPGFPPTDPGRSRIRARVPRVDGGVSDRRALLSDRSLGVNHVVRGWI